MSSASRIKTSASPDSVGQPPARTAGAAAEEPIPSRQDFFCPGARYVHPHYGVVEVTGVVQREIEGVARAFCELRVLASVWSAVGKVLIPVGREESARLRPIMSAAEADELLAFVKRRPVTADGRPFQKRMRIYADLLRTGDRHAVAEVLREMLRIAAAKPLSFGERKLLAQARAMLVTELALAKATTEARIDDELSHAFAA